MNLFNKNPFISPNKNTRIVGNNINFDEKKKLEDIKETMAKLKIQTPQQPTPEEPKKEINLKEKIDILKNINK
jgi:hypothetical protein